jgi:hypothetical protein
MDGLKVARLLNIDPSKSCIYPADKSPPERNLPQLRIAPASKQVTELENKGER